MRKALLLGLAALVLPTVASAQTLFQENFTYADSTTIGGTLSGSLINTNTTTGWDTHSGTIGQIKAGATFNRTITTTPAYPSQSGSGIQLLTSRGEDISHQFAQQTDGASVYVSALITPDAVPSTTTGSYFMHVAPNTVSGTAFVGRVWMAAGATPGTVKFGVSAISNTPTFGATEVALGTTVLVVLRYDLLAGASNNVARIYVLPAGSNITTEPVAAEASNTSAGTDPANIGAVALRQGTTASPGGNSGSMRIDGVRVGLSWNDAPLPVELNAFTAVSNGTSARLAWTTASETNNAGFAVEQQTGDTWAERGFVAGRGTTTERSDYTFEVSGLTAGTHAFRLRQTDTDGTVHYSAVATVEVGIDEGSARVTLLGQRAVRVETNEAQLVSVRVFDVLGRVVSQQRADVSGTGVFELPTMAAGAYVVRVEGERFAQTRTLVVR